MIWTAEGLKAKEENVPHNDYPRPQLKRDSYLCLNGKWDFEITKSKDLLHSFKNQILVPFAVEAPLSGISKNVSKGDYLHYRRLVKLPEGFINKRVFLHFDAVDQICDVYWNRKLVAHHEDGYIPFEAELDEIKEENELYLVAQDDTDSEVFPRGKQRNKRGGIWYTPTSGIWQSVWMESTPKTRITRVDYRPDFDHKLINVSLALDGEIESGSICISFKGKKIYEGRISRSLELNIDLKDNFKPWSPSEPNLYDVLVKVGEDQVASYFGMRKFSIVYKNNKPFFGLNNEPLFLSGLLDQGYYPDGGLTPPSDASMVKDITGMKDYGFNMIRKHIKIEPLRWYYHCDRLGMIVVQDIVNGGAQYKDWVIIGGPFIQPKWDDKKKKIQKRLGRSKVESRKCFISNMIDTVSLLSNVTSIAVWTLFNEGWGQFDAAQNTVLLKSLDDTRLIDSTSGWADQGVGDFSSHHVYFMKATLHSEPSRILSLSEFGGYTYFLKEHSFGEKAFGYKRMKDKEALNKNLEKLFKTEVMPLIRSEGLSISVYTQWSDVEDETNGLITYDRKIEKADKQMFNRLNEEMLKL